MRLTTATIIAFIACASNQVSAVPIAGSTGVSGSQSQQQPSPLNPTIEPHHGSRSSEGGRPPHKRELEDLSARSYQILERREPGRSGNSRPSGRGSGATRRQQKKERRKARKAARKAREGGDGGGPGGGGGGRGGGGRGRGRGGPDAAPDTATAAATVEQVPTQQDGSSEAPQGQGQRKRDLETIEARDLQEIEARSPRIDGEHHHSHEKRELKDLTARSYQTLETREPRHHQRIVDKRDLEPIFARDLQEIEARSPHIDGEHHHHEKRELEDLTARSYQTLETREPRHHQIIVDKRDLEHIFARDLQEIEARSPHIDGERHHSHEKRELETLDARSHATSSSAYHGRRIQKRALDALFERDLQEIEARSPGGLTEELDPLQKRELEDLVTRHLDDIEARSLEIDELD